MQLQVFKSHASGEWYFHARAKNGQIMFASEGYKRRASAVRAAQRLIHVMSNATIVVVET